jgi:hypothetical protein
VSSVVSRNVRVPERLDIELKKLAAEARLDKSDLYELGARIVLALASEGRLPLDLANILKRRDPKALETIGKVIQAITRPKARN